MFLHFFFTGKPLLYLNFNPHEPDNQDGVESCLYTNPYFPRWNDTDCNFIADGYVCEFTDK